MADLPGDEQREGSISEDHSGGSEGVDTPGGVSRRRFLQYGAASLGGSYLATRWWYVDEARAIAAPEPGPGPPSGPIPSLTTFLRRREDQLRLKFEFYNLKLKTTGQQPEVVRINPNAQAHVVVVFLPQHVMEEAFYEYDKNLQCPVALDENGNPLLDEEGNPLLDCPDGDPTDHETLASPPVGARLAGATRLAFRLPAELTSIPFTREGLLNWDDWIPSVVPVARPSDDIQPLHPSEDTPGLQEPGPLHTAIELPWWLVISPHVQTGWMHTPGPVTNEGVTELWHTRLGGRAPESSVDETDEGRMTVRAVWARDPSFPDYIDNPKSIEPDDGEDFKTHPIGMPFRTSLSPRDRFDLVISTSDYEHIVSDPPARPSLGYLPLPAQVRRLMLSSLGGWLDLHGEWPDEPDRGQSGTSLEAWRHRGTMGRDHYVRVVRSGFLGPFRHGASLVKVTERKFRTIGTGLRGDPKRRVAYNFQRYFLVVRQPVVDYEESVQPHAGRGFPFTRIRITTLITPNLDRPEPVPGSNLSAVAAFVPTIDGTPLRFHMVATDLTGRQIDFEAPVVFVDEKEAEEGEEEEDGSAIQDLITAYNGLDVTDPRRFADLQGSKVAVAEPDPQQPSGSTDLELHRLTFSFGSPAATTTPKFVPIMEEAEARLQAAEVAVGAGLGALPVVEFNESYLDMGFTSSQPGEVFVQLKDPKDLSFGGSGAGDRSGGIITPDISIRAISRKSGPVGGKADPTADPGEPESDPIAVFQGGKFDPGQFFPLDATLLGDISLGEVINLVDGSDFDLGDPGKRDKVIQLTTREEAQAVVTELRWKPGLHDFADIFIASLGTEAASLDVNATIVTPKGAPDSSTFLVVGDLRNFQVGLLPGARFILVQFDRLRFQAETGKKTDVDVEIREVVFAGPLEFVNQLKDYMSFSAGGFSIELEPTHLNAGFQIPIPSISVGVFSLSNISFAAGTIIPFTGLPIRFRFGFSTLDNPFLLTVWIFGGGGFFQLDIGADGVESFQAALEFGAALALDIGVASGAVSLTAGIYLAIGVETSANPEGAAELTGFLKLKGEVEVLGLITVTILMKAAFTYIAAPVDKAVAKALLIVEIDLTIWSGAVELEYEKRFGGSEDPVFHQAISPSDWSTYAAAFAPIGV